MNWLLSLLYYVFIIFQYLVIGKTVVSFSKLREKISYYIITGFFVTYAISFFIAFPSQALHISWNAYFILQLVVFLLVDAFCAFKNRAFLCHLFDKEKFNFSNVGSLLSNNWLLILFVVLFTAFSMANQMQYYELNYDDYYYIGKMVNLVGTPQLFNENYINGSFNIGTTLGLSRMVNTYEISYSFFATLFHIDIPFFCRATMVLHNYCLFTIVFKELACRFVKIEHAQYVLLPFFFFLIPAGWLYHGINLKAINTTFYIRSYDLWQFQTAAFYGGSIVRMMAIPSLYIFSEPLIRKMNLRNFLVVVLVCMSFIGFSSIFMQVLILFLFAILLVKITYMGILYFKEGKRKKFLVSLILGLGLIAVLIFSKVMDNFSFFNFDSYTEALNGYLPFVDVWYKSDLILNFGWIFALICFIIYAIQKNLSTSFWWIILCMFLIFRSNYFPEFIITSAFNYFFVPLRTVSSLQYMFVFALGVSFVQLISWLFNRRIFYNITSLASVLAVVIYFGTHYQIICTQNFLGSGISSAGWDFSRVVDYKTKMMPEIFVDVGDYFNSLPYDNYNLFAPGAFEFENHLTHGAGFVMSSNRIVTHISDGMNLTQDEINCLDTFCKGNTKHVEDVITVCIDKSIDYILVFDEGSKDELLQNGYNLVLQGSKMQHKEYYLIQL